MHESTLRSSTRSGGVTRARVGAPREDIYADDGKLVDVVARRISCPRRATCGDDIEHCSAAHTGHSAVSAKGADRRTAAVLNALPMRCHSASLQRNQPCPSASANASNRPPRLISSVLAAKGHIRRVLPERGFGGQRDGVAGDRDALHDAASPV